MTRNYLVLIGISVLIVGVVLSLLNVAEKIHLYLICGIVLFGVALLIIQSNRLNLSKKTNFINKLSIKYCYKQNSIH